MATFTFVIIVSRDTKSILRTKKSAVLFEAKFIIKFLS